MTSPTNTCICCGSPVKIFIDSIWDDRYGCPGNFKIMRCRDCGQMATMPPLTESDLPALYSTYYPRRDADYAAIESEAARVLRRGAAFKRWLSGTSNQGHYLARPGQRVLDIGSGSCISLLELRNLGIDACGVEADPNVSEIARHFGLKVHIGSIHDAPFPGEKFDLITLNQVIEHVPNPAALLQAVRERLAPGGRLMLSFPNSRSLARRMTGARWINWHVPYHQHHFNRRSIEILVRRNGFRVCRSRSVTPNVWTALQMRAMGPAPAEGQASLFWSAASAVDNAPMTFGRRVRNALMYRARRLITPSIALGNRLVDMSGLGDSLLVVLERE